MTETRERGLLAPTDAVRESLMVRLASIDLIRPAANEVGKSKDLHVDAILKTSFLPVSPLRPGHVQRRRVDLRRGLFWTPKAQRTRMGGTRLRARDHGKRGE